MPMVGGAENQAGVILQIRSPVSITVLGLKNQVRAVRIDRKGKQSDGTVRRPFAHFKEPNPVPRAGPVSHPGTLVPPVIRWLPLPPANAATNPAFPLPH